MNYTISGSGNMFVIRNNDTFQVQKIPRNECWYTFVNTDAPILYKIYYKVPERMLLEDAAGVDYTKFQKEDGTLFGSDIAFQHFLDGILTSETDMSSGFQKSAFGEMTVETLEPVVQMTAVYGLTPKARTIQFGSGTAGANDNIFFASTGAAINSGGNVFTERQLHYRAGQGALARGTVIFDTPASGSTQSWGIGNASDAYLFIYNMSGIFGVERRFGGHVIIQKLTISTPSSGSENATITIDGTGYTVPLTSGTAVHNTNEIAVSLNSQVSNWFFTQNNGFVICRSVLPAPSVGAFTLSSATAVGTFAEIAAGTNITSDFIAQTDWNYDKMDGTGPSGMTLDHQKGNVYAISFQYLGFGNTHFSIEDSETGKFQEVHQLKYANNNTTPSVSNPSFRINWHAENTTNDTDITINGASCAGFIEGKIGHTELGNATVNTKSVGTSVFTSILTLRNRITFGTNVNLSQILPQVGTVFADSSKGAIINICKGTVSNPITLGGTPDFAYHDEDNSIAEIDTDGTTVTGGKLVHSFIAGQGGAIDLRDFNELLLAGETMTIAAEIISGSSSDVTVTINWDEEL